jgi:hypothetical protein
MTTPGDLIIGGAAGAPTRLAAPGASRAILGYNGTTETWVTGGNNQLLGTDGTGNLTFINQTGFVSSSLPNGQILVGNAGVATATVMSGDATLSAAGILTLAAGSISGGTGGDIADSTITAADLAVGAVDLATTDVTGILPIAQGGTNSTAAATNGGVGYGTGTAHAYSAAGTSGQLLQSNGAAAPTWVNAPAIITASNGLTRTGNNIALGGTLTAATTIAIGGFNLNITGTGNVGIDATAPSERLHVTGNIRFSGALMPNNQSGTVGQVLTSDGPGLPPTWTTPSSLGTGTINRLTYWNTGSTVAAGSNLAWDNAGENLGIGWAAPERNLHLHRAAAVETFAKFTNTSTAIGAGNGFEIGINATPGDVLLRNYENTSMQFLTNNTERMRILGNGNIGLGTAAPAERLEVEGRIQLPNQVTTAAGNKLYANGGNLFWGTTNISNGVINSVLLGGNTVTSTMSIGSNNAFAVELRVNNVRGLRLEGGAIPSLITGSPANTVTAGVDGATVMGGGLTTQLNTATDNYSTVSGGLQNRAGNNSGTTADASAATVGGGWQNIASASQSTVAGGFANTASGDISSVGGGFTNLASGSRSVISGGESNTASGGLSSVGGGLINVASGARSAIPGGEGLFARSFGETVVGLFNSDYIPASASAYNGSDRIFTIGNGTATTSRSNAMTILKNGNVGIGITAPNAPLQFSNALVNRKAVLYDVNNNDHQYYGFGVNSGTLRYQVDATIANHVFFAATSASTSNELMRITGTGRVGIGTNAPANPLHVVSTLANALRIEGSTHTFMEFYAQGPTTRSAYFGYGNAGSNDVVLRNEISGGDIYLFPNGGNTLINHLGGGNVGIGTAAPSRKLSVVGDIDASGGVYFGSVEFFADGGGFEIMTNSDIRPETNNLRSLGTSTRRWTTVYATNGSINTSDARLKENITNLNHGLKSILELRPVSYNWIDDTLKQTKLGLIAQEAEKVIPEVVHKPQTSDDYYGLNYADLVPVLIKTAQELHVKIEALEKENNELKGANTQLKSEVTSIKEKQDTEIAALKKQMEEVMRIVGAEAKKKN